MDEFISVRQRSSITNFLAQEQSAEQQRKEDQAQAERNRVSATVFKYPSDDLKARCIPYTDDGSDIMSSAIRQQDAFAAFRLALDEGGVELLPSGVQKVYRTGLANKGVIELRDADNWMKIYEHLCELRGFFNSKDIIVNQPVPAPQTPAVEPTTEVNERQAVTDSAVSEYYGPRLQGFLDHLRDVFRVTLDLDQIRQCQSWFERNDVPLTGDNFGKLRRELLGLYSQQEQAEIELEKLETLDSPSAKAAYLRRLRAFD